MPIARRTTIVILTTTALAATPIAAEASSKVTAKLVSLPSTIVGGSALTVSGKITNGKGRVVEIEHKVGSSWAVDAVRTVPSNGRVSVTYPSLATGTYSFRLYVKKNRSHPAVAGPASKVTVLTPPPPPTLALGFPTSATENVAIPFTYGTSALPTGATLVLQREQGTANAWGTVLSLDPTQTSASAPALPLGAYTLRLAALSSAGKVLSSRAAAPLKVYGNVSFGALYGSTNTSTVIAAGHSFVYVNDWYNQDQILSTTSSPCRSIHIDAARPDGGDSEAGSSTEVLSIVQQTADPTMVNVGNNSITALDASVVPGQSWALNVHPASGSDGYDVYLNGYASCYSSAML